MIVDAEKGLAVISRSVIPFELGVLSLTFAESIIVPGKVEYASSHAERRLNTCIQH